jgi:hypothetical protein
MAIVGEKLGTNLQISQLACCGLGQEPFFLVAVNSFNSVDDFMKGCHVQELPVGSVRVAYMDWHGKRMCHVYQVSPVECTSIQIIATLRYE